MPDTSPAYREADDGGPAFPEPRHQRVGDAEVGDCAPGMSLRDWFAGQALAGLVANDALDASARTFAREAYAHADALLAARAADKADV